MLAARFETEGLVERGNAQNVLDRYLLDFGHPHQHLLRQPVKFVTDALEDRHEAFPAALIPADDLIDLVAFVRLKLDFGYRRRFEIDDVLHQALLDALAAAGAFAGIDEARLLPDADGEVPRGALDRLDFGIGQLLDVQVSAAIDHSRSERAHRAVVGRERLVELGHHAADGGAFFDQIDLVSGLGQIQRSLHASDAAADDQDRTDLLSCLLNHLSSLGHLHVSLTIVRKCRIAARRR